jgi:hypothetical protein
MKCLTIFSFLFCLFLNFSLNAQIKSNFKDIEFASYEIDKNGKIELSNYNKINRTGLGNELSKEFKGIKFYTFQLNIDQINALNTSFNKLGHLQDHVIKLKMDKGSHYAGSYNYIAYTTLDGRKEALCFITPLMSADFREFEDQFHTMMRKTSPIETKTEINTVKIKEAISILHKKSKYMPAIEIPEIVKLK